MHSEISNKRLDARAIFQAGLQAVAPGAAIKKHCRLDGGMLLVDGCSYDLDLFSRVIVLGAGKAAAAMALSIEEILGDRLSAGIISVKYGHLERLQKIKIHQAAHPVPDENGHLAAQAIFDLASSADEQTLVICLLSGGGSALLPMPVPGITLVDKQQTTTALLACGATIHEVNAIRKHLSCIKGGGLARAVYPATLVSLILSDVVGDDLDSIASGPCVPDRTSFVDCMAILRKYGIEEKIPAGVLRHLGSGVTGMVPETAKGGREFFIKTRNIIVGCNFDALSQARDKAIELGYNSLLLSSQLEGETRQLAALHMAIARQIYSHDEPLVKPACLLSGGETTVTIKGSGKGGRNQEFVLAAALNMQAMGNIVVLSAGTDGTDGPTDAAGAFADHLSLQRAAQHQLDPLDYLANNDSYNFFDMLGDLYKTGPTNTNVMDIRIILIY